MICPFVRVAQTIEMPSESWGATIRMLQEVQLHVIWCYRQPSLGLSTPRREGRSTTMPFSIAYRVRCPMVRRPNFSMMAFNEVLTGTRCRRHDEPGRLRSRRPGRDLEDAVNEAMVTVRLLLRSESAW